MTIVKENSPHLRRKSSLARMMLDVVIALFPTLAFATAVYQLTLVYPLLIALVTMIGSEAIYYGLSHMMKYDGKKHTFIERLKYSYKGYNINNVLVPLVSAIIYTLILPPYMPLYLVFVGALVGIVIGKLLFGGTGSNIFNPAAVGMVFAKLCYQGAPRYISNWYITYPDGVTSSTPLGGMALGQLGSSPEAMYQNNLLDMFLGKMPGTLGEAFSITILIGAIYLFARRAADIRISLTYLATFSIMMLFAGITIHALKPEIDPWYYLGVHFLSGGLLFGAIFMLTDPVTSPTNIPGRIIFAMIAAIVTVYIRLFGALPEGVAFSILIANMFVPVIEYYKWTSSKWNWKHFLIIGLMIALSITFMVLGLYFGGRLNG